MMDASLYLSPVYTQNGAPWRIHGVYDLFGLLSEPLWLRSMVALEFDLVTASLIRIGTPQCSPSDFAYPGGIQGDG